MNYLLDTNVLSELRKGQRAHPSVVRWSGSARLGDQYISVLVIGEISRGIELTRRRDLQQFTVLEKWFENVLLDFAGRIVPVDLQVARRWAQLGIPDPVPVIDGFLAATALVHEMTLVTRDRRGVARTGVRILDPFLA